MKADEILIAKTAPAITGSMNIVFNIIESPKAEIDVALWLPHDGTVR